MIWSIFEKLSVILVLFEDTASYIDDICICFFFSFQKMFERNIFATDVNL